MKKRRKNNMYIKYNLCDYGECIQKVNCLVVSTTNIDDKNYFCLRDITQKNYLEMISLILNGNCDDYTNDGFYNLSDGLGEYETREEAEKELENIAKAIEEGKHIYTITINIK